jgi:xylulokinase
MNRTVIALDLGTTSIKAILFGETGEILRTEKTPTPQPAGAEGYRPEEIWSIAEAQLLRLTAASPERPAGIAVTGMAEAGLILERDGGRELTGILPWFSEEPRSLAESLSPRDAEEAFRTTGLRASFKYGIWKYLRLLQRRALRPENTVWLSMCDYIVFRMTGRLVTDPTFAARTFVYDVLRGCWDERRIRSFGLNPENFPEVLPSGSVCGEWHGIPTAVAGHDHVCAAFGLLYGSPSKLCDSAGTSETYIGLLPQEGAARGFPAESGLLYGPFPTGGFFCMANVPSSGHSVEWFRKTLQKNGFSYEEMQRLSELGRGPGGILYFPYLTGMGAPWYRADFRGVLLGLGETQDSLRVLKGICEGIQYQAKWLLSVLEEHHSVNADPLVCAGGPVNNPAMMQMKADILGRTVQIPAVTEATAGGAAGLFLLKNAGGGAAAGFLRRAGRIEREYVPDPDVSRQYDEIFRRRYLPFTEYLKKFYDEKGDGEHGG